MQISFDHEFHVLPCKNSCPIVLIKCDSHKYIFLNKNILKYWNSEIETKFLSLYIFVYQNISRVISFVKRYIIQYIILNCEIIVSYIKSKGNKPMIVF